MEHIKNFIEFLKSNWLIAIIVLAAIIGGTAELIKNLETIEKSLSRMVLLMCRWNWKRHNTYPLKVIIRSVEMIPGVSGILYLIVQVLVHPRKPVILGECIFVDLTSKWKESPHIPIPELADDFQGWKVETLGMPRMYKLRFFAYGDSPSHEGQIQIESEGYICKSNIIKIV